MHLTHSCLQLCLRFCSANIQENHHISRAAYIIWDLIFKLPMDSSYGWNEDTTPTHLQHHHKTEPNLISLSWADNCFLFSMPYKLDLQLICLAEELPCSRQYQPLQRYFVAMQGDNHLEMSDIYCNIAIGSKYWHFLFVPLSRLVFHMCFRWFLVYFCGFPLLSITIDYYRPKILLSLSLSLSL